MIGKMISIISILIMLYSIGYYQGAFPPINELTSSIPGFFSELTINSISNIKNNPENYYGKTITVSGQLQSYGLERGYLKLVDSQGYNILIKENDCFKERVVAYYTNYKIIGPVSTQEVQQSVMKRSNQIIIKCQEAIKI